MGQMLPKPVESTLVERHGGKSFRVGVAELSGWRNNMEDAHMIIMRDTWGFFGVFDGHGGMECSKWVAKDLTRKVEEDGCPPDDAAVKKLVLDTDSDFLDTQMGSGSTATMCIVHVPEKPGDKHVLRVINAGDSRVILGRRDGTIIDGGGTDQGLTTDHKPNLPSERERIERCGGTVEHTGPCWRVNGDLAVSRGFGDAEYKKTGGPGPEDRPVTANPELGRFECDPTDFLLLVCDGVSEGDFPNPEVVQFVAEKLRAKNDPGEAAKAVCHQAVAKNSKDNVTCMIVLFEESTPGVESEFVPGPIAELNHKAFMTAWTAMADKAGLTMAQAAEKRYELIQELLADSEVEGHTRKELQQEAERIQGGPTEPPGAKASSERQAWFEEKAQKWQAELDSGGCGGDNRAEVMRHFLSDPDRASQLLSVVGGGASIKVRRVTVAGLAELKSTVSAHPALQWDDRMEQMADALGEVLKDDTDDTSHVRFPDLGVTAWLPTCALTNLD